MAKKPTIKHCQASKLANPKPLVVPKPKFDELLRKMSNTKGGKK